MKNVKFFLYSSDIQYNSDENTVLSRQYRKKHKDYI